MLLLAQVLRFLLNRVEFVFGGHALEPCLSQRNIERLDHGIEKAFVIDEHQEMGTPQVAIELIRFDIHKSPKVAVLVLLDGDLSKLFRREIVQVRGREAEQLASIFEGDAAQSGDDFVASQLINQISHLASIRAREALEQLVFRVEESDGERA